ncbi:Pycsar system effector family protein [Actinophytocola sediminis]
MSTTREQADDAARRADTKATTLLSLTGVGLAGVIALSTRQDVTGAGAVLLWVSLTQVFASVVLLLLAIRPRLNRHPVPGSWLYAATVGPSTLLRAYGDDAPRVVSAADELCVVARIARAKYRRVGVAVVLLLTGLATLVLSLLATAVSA